jgi:hypothetical protein
MLDEVARSKLLIGYPSILGRSLLERAMTADEADDLATQESHNRHDDH